MNLLQQYYELREKRLTLQHEADRIEQQEKDILYELTKDLNPDQEVYTRVYGQFNMKATRKIVPSVFDWELALAYIRAEAATDLLQRRLTESAVKARWDNGVTVPGIEKSIKWPVVVTRKEVQ